MAYKSIDEQFWTDPYIHKLSVQERYLYIYLITNPHTHYSGVYYLPLSLMIDETNLTAAIIKSSLQRLKRDKKIYYDDVHRIIWVVKMAKYQVSHIKSEEKKIKGIENHFKTLHDTPLIGYFMSYYTQFQIQYTPPIPYRYPTDTPINTVPITETETETETEYTAVTEIITHLNSVCNTNYKPSSKKTTDLIKARLKDGFTVNNFKTVIEKKYADWGRDEKMSAYLRPETLFGTKFEAYLNQINAKPKPKTALGIMLDLMEDESHDNSGNGEIIDLPCNSLS